MCEAPSLMNLGIGASVGGSVYSGLTARENNKASAAVARNNETVLLANAGLEKTRRELIDAGTALNEVRLRGRAGEILGAARANASARGLDDTTGSPLLQAVNSAAQLEVDVGLLRAQGQLEGAESYGREASIIQQAAGQNFAAASYDARADDALIASAFGAGTAFLNAQTRWAALNPASANTNRYSVGTVAGKQPWSIYG